MRTMKKTVKKQRKLPNGYKAVAAPNSARLRQMLDEGEVSAGRALRTVRVPRT